MKILLIGSSFSAIPFLRELKNLGAHVSVIGKLPDDPCHSYADASIFEDYSNPVALLDVCKEYQFDYIVPTCNDYSYVSGSYVANILKLPGFDNPEVTEILHSKDNFRRFCADIGVPSPQILGEIDETTDFAAFADRIDGPVLVKPVDSFSGRGVELIKAGDELAIAFERAAAVSRSKKAVVEHYVEGALHSHTSLIAGGQIIWHDFVDEFCEVYRYQVDRSSYPSRLSDEIRRGVQDSMQNIVTSLGLTDGLLHTQFIASEDQFWIIECMRRCPGDLYGHHFKFSFGFDYEAQFVAAFVGRKPQAPSSGASGVAIERRVLSVDALSPFFGLEIEKGAPAMTYIPLKNSGLPLEAAPFDKAGILFLKGTAGQPLAEIEAVSSGMMMAGVNAVKN